MSSKNIRLLKCEFYTENWKKTSVKSFIIKKFLRVIYDSLEYLAKKTENFLYDIDYIVYKDLTGFEIYISKEMYELLKKPTGFKNETEVISYWRHLKWIIRMLHNENELHSPHPYRYVHFKLNYLYNRKQWKYHFLY